MTTKKTREYPTLVKLTLLKSLGLLALAGLILTAVLQHYFG